MVELDFEISLPEAASQCKFLYVCTRCLDTFKAQNHLDDVECVRCNGSLVFFQKDPHIDEE